MKNRKLILSLLAIVFLAFNSNASDKYQLDKAASKLLIAGTSTIHDWEMEAREPKGGATIELNGTAVKSIVNADFKCPVAGLTSENSIMDKKTHKALNKSDFPEITFTLKEFDAASNRATGDLSIAGTTKTVSLNVDLEIVSDSQILVKGEAPVKMSDFGIDPPTAMMGTLKTGDLVNVKYNLVFKK